jgi:Ca2+/Na+ antiporter
MDAAIIGLFVPIIAIIMTFLVPIMAFYFWYRVRAQKSKERMLAIEKGVELPPEPVPVAKPATPLDSLRKGCVSLGVGVALIIFALVANVSKWFMGGGLIVTFVGVALVIWYCIATKKEEKQEEE